MMLVPPKSIQPANLTSTARSSTRRIVLIRSVVLLADMGVCSVSGVILFENLLGLLVLFEKEVHSRLIR